MNRAECKGRSGCVFSSAFKKKISGRQLRGNVAPEEGCTEQKAGRPAAPGPPPLAGATTLFTACTMTSRQPASGSSILVTKRKKTRWAARSSGVGGSRSARWFPLVFRLPGEREDTGPSATATVVAALPRGGSLWCPGARAARACGGPSRSAWTGGRSVSSGLCLGVSREKPRRRFPMWPRQGLPMLWPAAAAGMAACRRPSGRSRYSSVGSTGLEKAGGVAGAQRRGAHHGG